MRVLFITSKPIFPLVDGGCVASNQFLQTLLNANVDVTHLTIATEKHPFDSNAYPSDLVSKIGLKHVSIKTAVKAHTAFFHLFKSGSYNISRFCDERMEKLILSTISGTEFDAVILDSLYATAYLSTVRSHFKGSIFVRTHNVESEIWRGYADDTGGIKKWYLSRLQRDLVNYEKETLNSVDGVFSISIDDTYFFKEWGITSPVHTISVAVKPATRQADYSRRDFYHLGSMDWEPNVEAVKELKRYFQRVKKINQSAELHIAGKFSEQHIANREKEGIFVHGFVENPDDFAIDKGILVTPIFSGSGIRIKILEAMSLGIPVITTPTGALGIDYRNADCLKIAETQDGFVQKMRLLYEHEDLRKEIGENAANYIRKNHNIDAISQKLVEVLQNT